MENIIFYNDIIKKASERRNQMADALDELENLGCISEEYITYSLKFMTTEQLKYILAFIKLTLRTDINQPNQYNKINKN